MPLGPSNLNLLISKKSIIPILWSLYSFIGYMLHNSRLCNVWFKLCDVKLYYTVALLLDEGTWAQEKEATNGAKKKKKLNSNQHYHSQAVQAVSTSSLVNSSRSMYLIGLFWGIHAKHLEVGVSASVLWPPAAKSQLIGKDPDAGKD